MFAPSAGLDDLLDLAIDWGCLAEWDRVNGGQYVAALYPDRHSKGIFGQADTLDIACQQVVHACRPAPGTTTPAAKAAA